MTTIVPQPQGTFRVNLDQLDISWSDDYIDQKIVDRLKRGIREECRRYDPKNYVVAQMDEEEFHSARKIPTRNSSMPRLKLDPGKTLCCLHGKHRIAAAKEVLIGPDRWWPVEVYTNINRETKLYLMDGFSNETRPTGGMIYFKIRQCTLRRDEVSKKRWSSLFTRSERTSYRALVKKEKWVAIFDELMLFPGLQPGMRLGSIRKLIQIRCDEEILNYLSEIKRIWSIILPEMRWAVDRESVLGAQLKAPFASKNDFHELESKINQKKIFTDLPPKVTMERMRQCCVMIPSLDSFFDDCIYLEAIANCVEWLIPEKAEGTLRQRLRGYFVGRNSINAPRHFHTAYKYLIVFAMRYYDQIPKKVKSTNPMANPKAVANNQILFRFAMLAQKLGFDNDTIRRLSNSGTSYYDDDNRGLQPLVADGPRVPERERTGKPRMTDYKREQGTLTLEALSCALNEGGNEITAFFVRWCFFRNFFGGEDEDEELETDPDPRDDEMADQQEDPTQTGNREDLPDQQGDDDPTTGAADEEMADQHKTPNQGPPDLKMADAQNQQQIVRAENSSWTLNTSPQFMNNLFDRNFNFTYSRQLDTDMNLGDMNLGDMIFNNLRRHSQSSIRSSQTKPKPEQHHQLERTILGKRRRSPDNQSPPNIRPVEVNFHMMNKAEPVKVISMHNTRTLGEGEKVLRRFMRKHRIFTADGRCVLPKDLKLHLGKSGALQLIMMDRYQVKMDDAFFDFAESLRKDVNKAGHRNKRCRQGPKKGFRVGPFRIEKKIRKDKRQGKPAPPKEPQQEKGQKRSAPQNQLQQRKTQKNPAPWEQPQQRKTQGNPAPWEQSPPGMTLQRLAQQRQPKPEKSQQISAQQGLIRYGQIQQQVTPQETLRQIQQDESQQALVRYVQIQQQVTPQETLRQIQQGDSQQALVRYGQLGIHQHGQSPWENHQDLVPYVQAQQEMNQQELVPYRQTYQAEVESESDDSDL